jgi:RNA polymerase sigma factor for flagellar operon FliA
MKSATKSTTKSTTKPAARAAAQPTTQPTSHPTSKPTSKSTSSSAAHHVEGKSDSKVDAKPAVRAAAKPARSAAAQVDRPASSSAVAVAVRPAVDAQAEAGIAIDVQIEVTARPLVDALKPVPAVGVRASGLRSMAGGASVGGSGAKHGYAQRPIEELWREYRVQPSESLRNYLIEKYLELVRFTAERMHMKLPSEVEVDDLMSSGLFGLMDAIDAFDPDRGVKFETYCTQRIRGAIFDELRAMDWVPRLVRSRTAKVEKVRKSIEMETGRKATDAEVADRMKVDPAEFEKYLKDSRPTGVVSLNRKWFETDSSKDVREIDVIRDTRQESPVQQVQRQDLQTLITKGLSRAERLIVILYYYEEMTMKEIGTTLDLSESRVSQMHSSILARLKAQMQHRERDMAGT